MDDMWSYRRSYDWVILKALTLSTWVLIIFKQWVLSGMVAELNIQE